MEQFRYKRCFNKALIWALSAVILIYRNRDAITYPIFMAITLGILAWDCKSMGRSLIRDFEGKITINLFYCIALMLLSINKCLTASVDMQWGNGFGIFLLFICLLLKTYSGQEGKEVTDQLIKMCQLLLVPFKHIEKPFKDRIVVRKMTAGEMTEGKKKFRSVLIGLLIAVPLLAIILSLLASADLIFGDLIGDILDAIKLPEFSEDYVGVPFKLFLSFVAFYCWISCLPAEVFAERQEGKKFDAVVAITFNSLIAFVYLFFSGIQFVYLVGKMELPGGYTYAEYAHEGFYQLLAVTILNLILVSFCKKHFAENKVLKAILTIISLCTYVMIASSALRMYLYVGVYGLSHLRVYVLWLLVVLVVWTSVLTAGIFKSGIPFFRIITVFVTVWYLVLAFSFPDKWIAAYDIELLDEIPDQFLIYETYPDAAPVIMEDGRLWDRYCAYMYYDMEEYDEKNILQRIREFNFAEDHAFDLIRSNPAIYEKDFEPEYVNRMW
ncbi:MAG: DUF4173 domain-containing protein [Lachnospiraceae bacterium]|nr:DUF4173 domain-containing protein [Lachnospiraceae bacterium]